MHYSSINNTQKSIVPTKTKIHTIKFDASPQQLQWQIPNDEEMDQIEKMIGNNNGPTTRLGKKKSSTFSINDIKNTTQKQIVTENMFAKKNSSIKGEHIYDMFRNVVPSKSFF